MHCGVDAHLNWPSGQENSQPRSSESSPGQSSALSHFQVKGIQRPVLSHLNSKSTKPNELKKLLSPLIYCLIKIVVKYCLIKLLTILARLHSAVNFITAISTIAFSVTDPMLYNVVKSKSKLPSVNKIPSQVPLFRILYLVCKRHCFYIGKSLERR